MLRDETVTFAGYMHPHPLLHDVLVRIQTNDNSNPLDALSLAIDDLQLECEELTTKFKVCRETSTLNLQAILTSATLEKFGFVQTKSRRLHL